MQISMFVSIDTLEVPMRKLMLAFLLVFTAVILFADDAVIKSVKGKVEYSSDGQTWFPAEPNQVLKKGDYISTSFKSSAVVVANGSIINVKALTRMTFDELAKTSGGPQTELYLVSGKVQVEIKPSANEEITTFKVKSAMATASVRGTGIEYDGENLLVNHGKVDFTNSFGRSVTVNGGEFSNAGKWGTMLPSVRVKKPAKPVLSADSTNDEIDGAAEEMGSSSYPDGTNELLAYSSTFAPDTGSASKLGDVTQSSPAPISADVSTVFISAN